MESITLAADDEHQSHLLATHMPDTTELPAAPDAAGPKFQGDLLIFPPAEARILPTAASDGPPTPFILNLFTDASFPMTKHHRGPSTPSQPAGAAVLWKPWPGLAGHDPWHSRAFQVLACRDFCEAEVFAVVAALETAALLSHLMPELRQVTVFTDCKDAIRKLIAAAENGSDTLVKRAVAASLALDAKGVRAFVRWCPGHVGIEGNSKADELAKEARYYNFRHLVPRQQPASVCGYDIPGEYLERARRGDWWEDGASQPPRTDKKQMSIWRDCEEVEAPQDDGIVTPQPAAREEPPRKRQRTDEGPGPSSRHALLPKGTGMGVSVAGDQDGIVAGFIARSRETPPPKAAVNGAVERSEVADTSTQQIGASPNVSDSEEEDGNDTRSLTLGRSPEPGDEASLE
ncbi:hypothetical protein QIS74_11178 [Colletotrichum tabaci]|uniref:RNase H type-1 domain-containing protein n=1 Tax=Colletotrichum tabaci TaxID=1209068 RepID=A0AAV9SYE9_9PEZI